MLVDPAQVRVDGARERFGGRQVGVRLDQPAQLLGAGGEGGDEEVALAREVVVEQRLRDPGLARDLRLYDLAALTAGYRIASFLALGIVLLVAAYAYQRLRPEPPADLRGVPGPLRS
jgi:hypothetical protein